MENRKKRMRRGILLTAGCAVLIVAAALLTDAGRMRKVIAVTLPGNTETREKAVPSAAPAQSDNTNALPGESREIPEKPAGATPEKPAAATPEKTGPEEKESGRKGNAERSEKEMKSGGAGSRETSGASKAEDPAAGQTGKKEEKQNAGRTEKPRPQKTVPDAQTEAQEPQPETQPQQNSVPQEPEESRPAPDSGALQPAQEENTEPAAPEMPEPHTHTWAAKTRIVHHDAVTEQVRVTDQEAYTEILYETVPVYEQIPVYVCNVCGQEFENIGVHSKTHIDWETMTNPFSYHVEFVQGGQIGTQQVQTGSIVHPEQFHMETRIIREAYDEEVPDGYVCTGCGAER